jgi:hypothetical protein
VELNRINIVKQAKILENAERWKETQERIRKAAIRRAAKLEVTHFILSYSVH